jgi:hypothetical protein
MTSWHGQGKHYLLLSAFAKFRKATRRVCPSIRMEQLGSHWTDFHEIWHFNIFRKSVEKIQVSLKSNKNNRYFTWRPTYVFDLSRSILLTVRNVSDKICKENKNTQFYGQCLFFFENSAVYVIVWKSIVESGRSQVTILCTRIGHWVPKATNTDSECVIAIAFPQQQWFHKRASTLRLHVHWLSCLPIASVLNCAFLSSVLADQRFRLL